MTFTEQSDPLISGDLYRLLLQVALLGIEIREARAAMQMVEPLISIRPDVPHAHAVHAVCCLSLGQRDDAIRELESTLEHFPGFPLGETLLGVCMKLSGRSGWQSHLEAVIDAGRDEFAIAIACRTMGRTPEAGLVHVGAGSSETQAPPDFGSGHVMWA
jgi:hypothetical protein